MNIYCTVVGLFTLVVLSLAFTLPASRADDKAAKPPTETKPDDVKPADTKTGEKNSVEEKPEPKKPDAKEPAAEKVVAKITLAYRCKVKNIKVELKPGVKIAAGAGLQLEQGILQLAYANGATVLVQGPAEVIVDQNKFMMNHGKLVATIPKAAKDFKVVTASASVITDKADSVIAINLSKEKGVSVYAIKGKSTLTALGGAMRSPMKEPGGYFGFTAERNMLVTNLPNSIADLKPAKDDDKGNHAKYKALLQERAEARQLVEDAKKINILVALDVKEDSIEKMLKDKEFIDQFTKHLNEFEEFSKKAKATRAKIIELVKKKKSE